MNLQPTKFKSIINSSFSLRVELILTLLLLLGSLNPSSAFEVVRDSSLDQWVAASKNSRADILILGDSVVLHDNNGWDAGLQFGASQSVGLAGSGILLGRNRGQGEGIDYRGSFSSEWTPNSNLAYGGVATTSPYGRLTTVGSQTATVGVHVNGATLRSNVDYTLDVWGVSGPGGASYSLEQRRGSNPATTSYQESGFTIEESVNVVHRSHVIPASGFSSNEIRLSVENMTLNGIRLSEKEATGVTVTSIAYDGQSALDFYQDQLVNRAPQARQRFLEQIVEGGSGKLLIPIFEGFNDRNETEPSVNGITDGDSPEAFRDNIGSIISLLSNDWIDAGFDPDDLSFLTFGMYETATGNEELHLYSEELNDFALSTEGVSYIDISTLGPSFSEGFDLGYFADGVHLSRQGALHYGNQIFQTILSIPEPSSTILLVGFATLASLGQRRSKRSN